MADDSVRGFAICGLCGFTHPHAPHSIEGLIKEIERLRNRLPTGCRRPISTAPKDGTTFVSWDGSWWRRETRWGSLLGEHEGWHAFGFLPVNPTHWCWENEITPEIMDNIRRGNLAA